MFYEYIDDPVGKTLGVVVVGFGIDNHNDCRYHNHGYHYCYIHNYLQGASPREADITTYRYKYFHQMMPGLGKTTLYIAFLYMTFVSSLT